MGKGQGVERPHPADLWKVQEPVRIGISACLLGEHVRWDGGHKRNRFLTDIFGRFVEWVPVCPEVESGMGVPREPIRLVRERGELRMIAEKSGRDYTKMMRAWAKRRVCELAGMGLCGYVLKKDSPSCGMKRVRVYGPRGGPASRSGRGLFAQVLMEELESLPVEEEGRLEDPRLRENFVERVFAYRRLRSLMARGVSMGRLVAFHTAHKLSLLSHSPSEYQALGRLVAQGKRLRRGDLLRRYAAGFMRALSRPATARRHVNVLHHLLGYLREHLDGEDRAELLKVIEDYRTGLVPLIVPLTLVRHHIRRLKVEYLEGQVYLEPHPKELMLRNHV